MGTVDIEAGTIHYEAAGPRDGRAVAARRLGGFTKPSLVAWSADDAFFPVEDGRRLASALPDASMEVVDGARTFSMLDQPDRLAALIGEFAAVRQRNG